MQRNMFLLSTILVMAFSTSNSVVYGVHCDVLDHPFMAHVVISMRIHNETYSDLMFCSGVLVSLEWTLTGAHCIMDERIPLDMVTIYVGYSIRQPLHSLVKTPHANTQQIGTAVRGIKHPNFDKRNDNDLRYDVGLLKTKEPFELSPTVRPVYFPLKPNYYKVCPTVEIIGWGSTHYKTDSPRDRTLQCASIKLLSPEECIKKREGVQSLPHQQGLFRSDSGGPLMCGERIIGVTSQGAGCGQEGLTAIYTNLEVYYDFIQKNTRIKIGAADAKYSRSSTIKSNVIAGGTIFLLGYYIRS